MNRGRREYLYPRNIISRQTLEHKYKINVNTCIYLSQRNRGRCRRAPESRDASDTQRVCIMYEFVRRRVHFRFATRHKNAHTVTRALVIGTYLSLIYIDPGGTAGSSIMSRARSSNQLIHNIHITTCLPRGEVTSPLSSDPRSRLSPFGSTLTDRNSTRKRANHFVPSDRFQAIFLCHQRVPRTILHEYTDF